MDCMEAFFTLNRLQGNGSTSNELDWNSCNKPILLDEQVLMGDPMDTQVKHILSIRLPVQMSSSLWMTIWLGIIQNCLPIGNQSLGNGHSKSNVILASLFHGLRRHDWWLVDFLNNMALTTRDLLYCSKGTIYSIYSCIGCPTWSWITPNGCKDNISKWMLFWLKMYVR